MAGPTVMKFSAVARAGRVFLRVIYHLYLKWRNLLQTSTRYYKQQSSFARWSR